MTAGPRDGNELAHDLRHAENNKVARERAAEQLRPAIKRALADILEISEDEVQDYRDMLKAMRGERKARAERKEAGLKETIKWVIGATLGALLTYIATHMQTGGGK